MTPDEQSAANRASAEFARSDLLAASRAAVGSEPRLRAWGEAVLHAVGALTDERGRPRVDSPLLQTMTDTAGHLYRAITPFQGMLEAPRSIIEVYQTHKHQLRELVVTHDQVLTAVLEDLAARVMDKLDVASWRDLETVGALPPKPPRSTGAHDPEP